jgi:sulfite exporter TauE/SafE
MGRNLGLTFLSYIIIGVFVGYLGTMALDAGAGFREVFRFTGTAAVMAYTFGFIGDTIWYGQPLKPFLHDLADSIVFGLLTGAVFAFMWPALETPGLTVPGVNG